MFILPSLKQEFIFLLFYDFYYKYYKKRDKRRYEIKRERRPTYAIQMLQNTYYVC